MTASKADASRNMFKSAKKRSSLDPTISTQPSVWLTSNCRSVSWFMFGEWWSIVGKRGRPPPGGCGGPRIPGAGRATRRSPGPGPLWHARRPHTRRPPQPAPPPVDQSVGRGGAANGIRDLDPRVKPRQRNARRGKMPKTQREKKRCPPLSQPSQVPTYSSRVKGRKCDGESLGQCR